MAIIRWYEQPDRWHVTGELERMKREMNRLFTDYFGGRTIPLRTGVFPAVNITEDAQNFYIRSELPGIDPETIEISVEGEAVTLTGERKLPTAENVSYHRRERESGRFSRILTLPSRVDTESVSAAFKNGVLKIVLPKAPEARPKQIKVSGA